MILAVVGPRDYTNEAKVHLSIDILRKQHPEIDCIVTGDANGGDAHGRSYAEKHDLKLIVHEAQWDDLDAVPCKIKTNSRGKQYNALAGFNRNSFIVRDAEMMLAVDLGTPGTGDSITKARDKGIMVHRILS